MIAAQPTAEGAEAMREKLTQYGIQPGAPSDVTWNFEKFVIDRKGQVIARFSPDITADDPRLTKVLDEALAG
jgi:glutathione peroxidase